MLLYTWALCGQRLFVHLNTLMASAYIKAPKLPAGFTSNMLLDR